MQVNKKGLLHDGNQYFPKNKLLFFGEKTPLSDKFCWTSLSVVTLRSNKKNAGRKSRHQSVPLHIYCKYNTQKQGTSLCGKLQAVKIWSKINKVLLHLS